MFFSRDSNLWLGRRTVPKRYAFPALAVLESTEVTRREIGGGASTRGGEWPESRRLSALCCGKAAMLLLGRALPTSRALSSAIW